VSRNEILRETPLDRIEISRTLISAENPRAVFERIVRTRANRILQIVSLNSVLHSLPTPLIGPYEITVAARVSNRVVKQRYARTDAMTKARKNVAGTAAVRLFRYDKGDCVENGECVANNETSGGRRTSFRFLYACTHDGETRNVSRERIRFFRFKRNVEQN